METKEYRLTDVCDFQGGTQPPKEEWINEPREGYVRMLQIRDFTQDKAEHVGFVKDTKKLNKCNKDDILIGRYGASVGKILTGLSGAYNVAIIKTIPNESIISKKYLYYVLTGTAFQNFILTIGSRAAQAGFNKDDLSNFRFHLPVLLENQEKIVTVLEKTNNLLNSRKKSFTITEEYKKMYFLKLFGDPISNSYGWGKDRLENVTLKITDGKHGDCNDEKDSGFYFLSAKDLVNGKLKYEDVREITEADFNEVNRRTMLQVNDIVLGNTGASIGKIGIVTDSEKASKTTFQKSISVITVDERVLLPTYVKSFLEYNRGLFNQTSYGSAMPNLLLSQIRNFSILIPPIPIQEKFALVSNQIDKLYNLFLFSKDECSKLFENLSYKALTGRLNLVEVEKIVGNADFIPKIDDEVTAIKDINNELEEFHNKQPHTGAPEEIDNKIRQLEAELKIKGEVPFWDEYVKYRIIKGKFQYSFTFEQLWQEILKFPFETVPEYDEVASMIFKLLEEEKPFLKQNFNKEKNQIELIVNETA